MHNSGLPSEWMLKYVTISRTFAPALQAKFNGIKFYYNFYHLSSSLQAAWKRPNSVLILFGELILSLHNQIGKRGIGQQKDVKKENIIIFPEYILNFLLETDCDIVL